MKISQAKGTVPGALGSRSFRQGNRTRRLAGPCRNNLTAVRLPRNVCRTEDLSQSWVTAPATQENSRPEPGRGRPVEYRISTRFTQTLDHTGWSSPGPCGPDHVTPKTVPSETSTPCHRARTPNPTTRTQQGKTPDPVKERWDLNHSTHQRNIRTFICG